MSENKRTVERYMDGFDRNDHAQILACLTDDVEWIIPGVFHVAGKTAFDQQIDGDNFVAPPIVTTTRLVEENDVVIAEGNIRFRGEESDVVKVVFCDVFVMEKGKIKELTSYLMPMS